MHTVGEIDRRIYKCITNDITTNEVIITDERIMHIKERHPDDYEVCLEINRFFTEKDKNVIIYIP